MGKPKHGTTAAYTRHQSDGEQPCKRCRAAKAAYDRDRYSAPEQQAKARLSAKAQRLAYGDLARAHYPQYRELYTQHRDRLFAEHKIDARRP